MNRPIKLKGQYSYLRLAERLFEYMEIPEEKKMSLVAYKLTEGILLGWNKQISRIWQRKARVRSWTKMKCLLKTRFLPPDYEPLFQH
jgi:hypothetical protein